MAGAFTNNDRDRVLAATDLLALIGEHLTLRPQGREHVGLCPFHDDKTPSFRVVTHKGNAFYKCFACGAAGNAIDFVMNFHRMEFPEALRHLASRAGVTLTDRFTERSSSGPNKTDLHDANAFALRTFQRWLADESAGAAGRQVLADRRITQESISTFMLGVALDGWDHLLQRVRKERKDARVFEAAGLLKSRREGDGWYDSFRNRVMFPIWDELGNPIAFGARKIDPQDEPKYLNSPESAVFSKSRALYALHLAKKAIIDSKTAVVTEGYTDVIACHAAGFTNVVATLGTALTREHARILKRLCSTVVLLFDGDEAGQKAADRAIEVFFNETIDVRICTLPDALDPDEILRQPNGPDRFRTALAESQDVLQYMMKRFGATLNAAVGLSARQQRLEAMLSHLVDLGFNDMPGVRRALVVGAIADRCGLSAAQVDDAARAIRRTSSQRTEQSSLGERTSIATCPQNRRLAERRLLAVLIASPALLNESIDAGEGHWLPVHEVHSPEAMRDETHREISTALSALSNDGVPISVQGLMANLASASARDVVSALYLEGLDRLGDTMDDAVSELRAACVDLDRLDRREQVQSHLASASADGDALERVRTSLEAIRRRGADQTAIARRIRV